MALEGKVTLLNDIDEALRPRMFANMLEEAMTDIQDRLDGYDIQRLENDDHATDTALEAFISAKRVEGRSEKTLVRYEYLVGKFMNFCKVSTRKVTTYHVRSYLASEAKRGVADSTLESIRQVLSSYFGWLEHERLISLNPMRNIGAIKCQKKIREAFTDADLERLKRACKHLRDSAIINVLISTGCRVSELCGMNRSDIDFTSGECIVLGKGNKERTVYLDGIARMTLKEYLATRSDDDPALFLGQRKERLTPFGIRTILRKVSEKAGVANTHPHRFRRTMITNLLNAGMPIQEVAIVAGHDKMDTTMHYFASDKSRIKSSFIKYGR